MIKDYQEITKDISGALSTLRQHVPDVKTKELIALA